MNSLPSISSKRALFLLLAWGLILEFPIRYFACPDPWIHNADHWYFVQPYRLAIEISFVLLAFLPFLVHIDLKALLVPERSNKNRLFLLFGIAVPLLVFGLQQWTDILQIQSSELWRYVPIWFVTGLFVGIGQELSFRGLIYTGLHKLIGIKWAVILSTLCFVFGSIHSPRIYTYFTNGYTSEAILLIVIFSLTGLLFAWIRIRTKNILIPAIAHGIGNAITWATYVVIKLHM